MSATKQLNALGQSIWLDNITRKILDDGTLARYISDLSVTGLTSNPSIFDNAIKHGDTYDTAIHTKVDSGLSGEALFFELAIEDLSRAADLFYPIHKLTAGVDGFVSLEVSPLLAYDTAGTVAQAKELHAKAGKDNLFIKVPGTPEGLPAIEELIFNGIPINVTLLFSAEQYLEAAYAYIRGLERRVNAGLTPLVESVASVFISRWDGGVKGKVPAELENTLGIAVGKKTYKAYRDLLDSDRWQRLENLGARPQRALWASTGTKDPKAPDTLYIKAFASPNTVNTMPEPTLLAFHDHGDVGPTLPRDGGDFESVIQKFADHGISYSDLAAQLQSEGAKSFVASWTDLLSVIETKSKQLA